MKQQIEQTFAGLKDFQLRTVEYTLKRFREGQQRMLIADEVGLGKTIVAKGIIAGLFDEHQKTRPTTPFNVVYICSNQAIAQSNIRKLNFTNDESFVIRGQDDDRITLLAYKTKQNNKPGIFSLRAFTPATSFDEATSAGRKDERILLYQLLSGYEDLRDYRNSLKWILQGTRRISPETWEADIDKIDRNEGREFHHSVKAEFRRRLVDTTAEPADYPKCYKTLESKDPVRIWRLILNLAKLNFRKNSPERFLFTHELVAQLRRILAQSCLHLLDAHLYILDEFQRYKNLISPETNEMSAAMEMASAIFKQANSKILMLSATPFKAYTSDFDQLKGEIHHKEFRTVLEFLAPEKTQRDWVIFEENRSVLFDYMRRPSQDSESLAMAKQAKEYLQRFYRSCLARTERLSVAKDKDALVQDILRGCYIDPVDAEIRSFIQTDAITKYLNQRHKLQLPVPLEYAKSAPYVLSFLEGYRQRDALIRYLSEDRELQKLIREKTEAWLNLETIRKYEPLALDNLPSGRLRKLFEVSLTDDMVLLLWVPPTLPYYALGGPFANNRHYSKTLVFSSWRLVPRMISTIVSYEAERRTVGNPQSISARERANETDKGKRSYFDRPRIPRPQITFQLEDGRPRQMEHMVFAYPSPTLTKLYDPQQNLTEKRTISEIKDTLVSQITKMLTSPEISHLCSRANPGDWRQWYWAAAPILDRYFSESAELYDWFEQDYPYPEIATDADDESSHRHEKGAKLEYFAKLKAAYLSAGSLHLPELNHDQASQIAEYLATLVVSSPAVCFLRTLMRDQAVPISQATISKEMVNGAFEVALGFITYFNKPENISIVRLAVVDSEDGSYTDKVLRYCQMGNIQSLLDEFVYLIREQEGIYSPTKLASYISDILSVRTTQYKIDSPESLIDEAAGKKDPGKGKNRIRTHFAVDFGGQKLQTAKSQDHQINIRQAFNSPFAPFVLATTSVGQEGLDFHLYCRRIFHWNLPANAIDIEQREGRINRYKGHIIRQILVQKYGGEIALQKAKDAWQELFHIAESREGKGAGKCELIPYWHSEQTGDLRIERYVPIYTLSKEVGKYEELLRVLAFYRLTFGQPRQGELIAALAANNSQALNENIEELMLNLSPLDFYHA